MTGKFCRRIEACYGFETCKWKVGWGKGIYIFWQMKSSIWLVGWQTGCTTSWSTSEENDQIFVAWGAGCYLFSGLFLVETPPWRQWMSISVFSRLQRKAGAKRDFFLFNLYIYLLLAFYTFRKLAIFCSNFIF